MSDNFQSSILEGLNENQIEAVTTTEQSTLILAGAGCGKTAVITRKIAWLLNQEHYQGKHIAAITFTNKAADEMQRRIKKIIKSRSDLKQLTIKTFHSLGLAFLREYYHAANLPSSFTLLNAADSFNFLQDICTEHSIVDKAVINQVKNYISQNKNDNISPEKALETAAESIELTYAEIYQHYEKRLNNYGIVDFDDLLLKPLQLLQRDPDVQQGYGQRYRHLLVDEYQDTNDCQYQLFQLLINPQCRFTAVGDDNQAVYEWRGANPANMQQLQKDHPECKIIPLKQNYRSTNIILKASNHLISHNEQIVKKELWSNLGEGENLQLIAGEDEADEAKQVLKDIRVHKIKTQSPLHDYCILYRNNFQSDILEKELRMESLPYHISGGTSLFERVEIKNLIGYLKLMVNHTDDLAFLRIINTPKRDIGSSLIAKLQEYKRQHGNSLFENCNNQGLLGMMNKQQAERFHFFYQWLLEKHQLINNNLGNGIQDLLEDIDYFNWLKLHAKTKPAGLKQIDRVNDFIKWLETTQQVNPNFDLTDLINRIAVIERLDDNSSKEGQIRLMTIHAAKGLEFPNVYLFGFEEDTLPHHRSLEQPNGVTEERRLAYVALTRAQNRLTLSHSLSRKTYKTTIPKKPSRFLKEIPDEYFNKAPIKLTSEEEEKEINKIKQRIREDIQRRNDKMEAETRKSAEVIDNLNEEETQPIQPIQPTNPPVYPAKPKALSTEEKNINIIKQQIQETLNKYNNEKQPRKI